MLVRLARIASQAERKNGSAGIGDDRNRDQRRDPVEQVARAGRHALAWPGPDRDREQHDVAGGKARDRHGAQQRLRSRHRPPIAARTDRTAPAGIRDAGCGRSGRTGSASPWRQARVRRRVDRLTRACSTPRLAQQALLDQPDAGAALQPLDHERSRQMPSASVTTHADGSARPAPPPAAGPWRLRLRAPLVIAAEAQALDQLERAGTAAAAEPDTVADQIAAMEAGRGHRRHFTNSRSLCCRRSSSSCATSPQLPLAGRRQDERRAVAAVAHRARRTVPSSPSLLGRTSRPPASGRPARGRRGRSCAPAGCASRRSRSDLRLRLPAKALLRRFGGQRLVVFEAALIGARRSPAR